MIIIIIIDIDTDMPINVYAWFYLSTAKSNFSLVSPVADRWNTIRAGWFDLFIEKDIAKWWYELT